MSTTSRSPAGVFSFTPTAWPDPAMRDVAGNRAGAGIGQMLKPAESDRLGYEDVMARAEAEGRIKLVERLKAIGPPPYPAGRGCLRRYMAYLMPQNGYMAADTVAAGGRPYIGDPRDTLNIPEYRQIDKIGSALGLAVTFNTVYPLLQSVDFLTQANELNAPVFVVAGANDLNAWAPTAVLWVDVLRAPSKKSNGRMRAPADAGVTVPGTAPAVWYARKPAR